MYNTSVHVHSATHVDVDHALCCPCPTHVHVLLMHALDQHSWFMHAHHDLTDCSAAGKTHVPTAGCDNEQRRM
jgi:hypothetical protein